MDNRQADNLVIALSLLVEAVALTKPHAEDCLFLARALRIEASERTGFNTLTDYRMAGSKEEK